MDIALIQKYLDSPEAASPWLETLGLADPQRAHANLLRIATSGLTLDLMASITGQLERCLTTCSDPDMALNHLERFVNGSRSPLQLGALFERDPSSLSTLIQIFSTSQYLSDILITDHESFELLRLTEGKPLSRDMLTENLVGEVNALKHDPLILQALRRFKRREMLRIAYGDIVLEQPLRIVTQQISNLADAMVEAALTVAWRTTIEKRGEPKGPDGNTARFTVLALGKLGGRELNYSSDIDLIFLYDHEGQTAFRRPISNAEFFAHLGRELVRMLTEPTELGVPYRVDLRLRPNGDQGPMVIGYEAAMQYYENRGRTWERQAFIKARTIAGDAELGRRCLDELTPWIFRRYLGQADISGIKALKRRIENRTICNGDESRNVKTGHGGIRDIEFTIQFLQLLNGSDLPRLRTGNTIEAIARLEETGCLSHQESEVLQQSYTFLRRCEHLLQIMCDLQTHTLPTDTDELRKLSLRMGFSSSGQRTALAAFQKMYDESTALNRRILDHILHDAFGDDAATAAEIDLVLDPAPSSEQIEQVLSKYSFQDVHQAYKNLMSLAEEKIRFLSTRRCRHFLASIAPQLLEAIAATPDPDSTLVNLGQVSDSLGGKGVLWELFSANRPSLELYVRLCAYAPYLCSILTSNPGMIDGLMDSLIMDKLPSPETLKSTMTELCRGAEDSEPILHSFKNDQQLRVGVRDLLGKSDVRHTTAALADIAQVCLEQIVAEEFEKLSGRLGFPMIDSEGQPSRACELSILGLGKFGGHELNFHSDLDIIFLYEAEGHTKHLAASTSQTTTCQHFYGELGQRIIKRIGKLGAFGRLYEIDARLRPTGKSGPLALSLEAFARYYAEDAALWERQALCRGRVVFGTRRMARLVKNTVETAIFEHRWRKANTAEIHAMRKRLQDSVPESNNLKRGVGGIVDIEFIVQLLQLRFGRRNPKVRIPNTLDALDGLVDAGYLEAGDGEFLQQAYRFLRQIESFLKLMNQPSTSLLPESSKDRSKLAHLMGLSDAEQLQQQVQQFMTTTREKFDRIFAENGAVA